MRRPGNAMFNRNTFKLGIFSPTCSGGMAVTAVPERRSSSWDNNLKLAQIADAAGIEFLLPIARWLGYGGSTNFQNDNRRRQAVRHHGPFDWVGQFFKLKHVFGNPKPVGGVLPPIINAGSSAEGRDFATCNADFLFTVLIDLEQGKKDVVAIRGDARARYGRDIEAFTTSYVVCRPTTKEAADYHRHCSEEQADWPAVDRLMELQGLHAKSFPPAAFTLYRGRFAAGHGVYPLVGDPDHVADELVRISAAGFAGTTITFVNDVDELP